MLGSVHDAEDALQEVSLRAWRGLSRFEGRSSLKSWLYTIATNTCLNQIEKRPKRVLPIDYAPAADPHGGPGEPVVESVWVEPYPDELLGLEDGFAGPEARYEQRESVELAFVAALQLLPAEPARGADPARGARLLGPGGRRTRSRPRVASVNSALQRARKTVEERLPEQSQQATLRALGDDELARARRALRGGLGAERRRDGRGHAGRGRDLRDAPARELVRRRGLDPDLPGGLAAVRRLALAPDPGARERAAGAGVLRLGRGRAAPTCRSRSTCSRFRGEQISDVDGVRRARHRDPGRRVVRALGRRADRPERGCSRPSSASGCRSGSTD